MVPTSTSEYCWQLLQCVGSVSSHQPIHHPYKCIFQFWCCLRCDLLVQYVSVVGLHFSIFLLFWSWSYRESLLKCCLRIQPSKGWFQYVCREKRHCRRLFERKQSKVKAVWKREEILTSICQNLYHLRVKIISWFRSKLQHERGKIEASVDCLIYFCPNVLSV